MVTPGEAWPWWHPESHGSPAGLVPSGQVFERLLTQRDSALPGISDRVMTSQANE